jgi:hypothetical protein
MSKRYGKYRVPGCKCESNFTCGECLANRPPYFFTPGGPESSDHHIGEPPTPDTDKDTVAL